MEPITYYGHQGDIEIRVLESPPDVTGWEEITDPTQHVVAYGEATGHAHRLQGAVKFFRAPDGFRTVALIGESGRLGHEEHRAHGLGGQRWYAFGRQQEANLEAAGWVRVTD